MGEWLPGNRKKSAEHAGKGHRDRLRQRLLSGGAEALADYELLEFLLFSAIRQGDTKPLAKLLIAHFGSLSAVLAADPRALQQVKGLGEASAAALYAVNLAAKRMARGAVQDKPVLGS